jgi:hypothetical protein
MEPIFEVAGNVTGSGADNAREEVVDEELKRGFGLSIKEIEPFLRVGGVWPNVTVKREPPPEDKLDKANLLSPNPGTGD